eukprot:scaffold3426_cov145-Amphora_coffeaeformis.AAC.7
MRYSWPASVITGVLDLSLSTRKARIRCFKMTSSVELDGTFSIRRKRLKKALRFLESSSGSKIQP